jgi:hypothetical protein
VPSASWAATVPPPLPAAAARLRLERLLVKRLPGAAQQLLEQLPAAGVGEQLPEHAAQRLGVYRRAAVAVCVPPGGGVGEGGARARGGAGL